MIIFYDDSGAITGHQTFPATYSGPQKHLSIPDDTDTTDKYVVDGRLSLKPSGLQLDDMATSQRRSAMQAVANAANYARSKYMKSDKAAIYAAKVLEAKRFNEAGRPSNAGADYPFLYAESIATDCSVKDCAEAVDRANRLWLEKGPQIEGAEKRAKMAINSANSIQSIKAAQDAAIETLRNL